MPRYPIRARKRPGRGGLVRQVLVVGGAVVPSVDYTVPIDDTLALADARVHAVGKAVADSLTLADARAHDRSATLTDSLTLADAQAYARGIPLADTISLSDEATPVEGTGHAANPADDVALADALTIDWVQDRAGDAVTLTDARVHAVGKAVADSLSLTDSIATAAAISLTLSDILGMAYRGVVLADSPLLYWRLDESIPGTGTAADDSGNGRTGTYVGSPPSSSGLLLTDSDTAVDFDGSTDYITSTYNPFAQTATRTFEAWVRRDSSGTTDAICGGDGAGNHPNIAFTGTNFIMFSDAAAASQTWTGPFGAATTYHVVVTWNGSSKQAELWLNGVSQGTKTFANDFHATPGNLIVGARGNTFVDKFDGVIDEFAIYSSILSSAQIAAHYNAGFNALVDSAERIMAYVRSPADGVILTDQTIDSQGIRLGDTVALTDDLARVHTATRAIDDALALTDALIFAFGESIADTVALADEATPNLFVGGEDYTEEPEDSVALADALTITWVQDRTGDTITISDVRTFAVGKSIADSVVLTDALARTLAYARTVSDGVVLTDQTVDAQGIRTGDTVSLADSATRVHVAVRSVTDSVALADARTFAQGEAIADTLALTDSATPELNVGGFNYTVDIEDSLAVSDIDLGYGGGIYGSGLYGQGLGLYIHQGKAVTDAIALTDSATPVLAVAHTEQIDDSLALTDALTIDWVQDRTGDTVTLSDLLARTVVYNRTPADGVIIIDQVLDAQGIRLGDVVSLTDAIFPVISVVTDVPGSGHGPMVKAPWIPDYEIDTVQEEEEAVITLVLSRL